MIISVLILHHVKTFLSFTSQMLGYSPYHGTSQRSLQVPIPGIYRIDMACRHCDTYPILVCLSACLPCGFFSILLTSLVCFLIALVLICILNGIAWHNVMANYSKQFVRINNPQLCAVSSQNHVLTCASLKSCLF